MTLLAPLGLLALGLAIPIVILHMLTPRRPSTPVSSLEHWDGLRHSITAAEPWQRLRWSLLLVLQLLAVALFATALARPAVIEQAVLAEHTVFIVDASGSMAAIDGRPDRLSDAVERALALREEVPANGLASVVVADAHPHVLLEASDDGGAFRRALETIRTTAADADFESAFALAESLSSADRPTGFVLISDGDLDEVEQRLAPLGTRFEAVGSADVNRAITDLSVTSGPGGIQARVTVESTGGPDAIQLLRLDVDGVTVDRRELTIPAGEVVEETFELPLGSRVAAFLDGQDLLAADNQRYAAAPVPGSLKVRVHGDATFFVDELLASIPQVDRDLAPDETPDLEVFVGAPVPPEPTVPFLAIDVPGGIQGVTPVGRADNPIPTLVTSDPLMEDIDVSRMAIAEAQVVVVESGQVLLGAPGVPLLVRGHTGVVPFFYLTFTLEQSNLPVEVAFPILGSRMVGELSAVGGTASALTVGDTPAAVVEETMLTDPRGVSQKVGAGARPPRVDRAGFWTLTTESGEETVVAVNPATTESHLAPVRRLEGIRPAVVAQDDTVAEVARSLLPWFLAALLAVLAFEFVVGRRARGVGARQWRAATALRVVIVALVVGALVDPAVNRAADSVTTVFVVDVSDSLGSSVAEARRWVGAALVEAAVGDRWAVVEVGADARVATPLGDLPYVGGAGVETDATSLARGLRLAESLLSGETRERIVVISDGRSNTGDLDTELDRLASLGAVVDVHTVRGEIRADAAVAVVDAPSSVGEGESYDVTVEVVSSIAGTAAVSLLSGDTVVERRSVELAEGSNRFGFTVEAGAPGLETVRASVSMLGDSVSQNDLSETAVEVRGPASVLIVEGDEGNGALIDAALESRGLRAERIPLAEMPGLERLAAHRAVVLVDVSARDTTEDQVATLDGFVRDLGRGLVVVGGDDSFALGGYQDTALEALLPVLSEAEDTAREATVAEVLLVDTSESMGACHCSEDGTGQTMEGGVNKTDISKAAAARAAAVLSANDELGLLAFGGSQRWLVELQPLPSQSVIDGGIAGLTPFGETRVIPALREAVAALRQSNKELKHIILFTDGFTPELSIEGFTDPQFMRQVGSLVEAAAELAADGITLSVVGTGEGATAALEEVAIAGGGRFYPGHDLDEIPEIFVKEARLAARSFINEGEFYPTVTAASPAVRDLASSPALLGFVATTAKPTAEVQLRVGEFADPLLASWRIGLGQVTVWTSDVGDRWAAPWAAWGGYADFWSDVVRETFPLAGSEGQRLEASIADDVMTVTLEGSEAWPAGTTPEARIGFPDGTATEIRLERVSDFEFGAVVPARQGGTYAVGVGVVDAEGRTVTLSAIASRTFAAEYLPGEPDADLMAGISSRTGGRGEIVASAAFEPTGLAEGRRLVSLRWLLLLLAALAWPIDVALRRLRLRGRREDLLPPAAPTRPTPRTPSASTSPATGPTPRPR